MLRVRFFQHSDTCIVGVSAAVARRQHSVQGAGYSILSHEPAHSLQRCSWRVGSGVQQYAGACGRCRRCCGASSATATAAAGAPASSTASRATSEGPAQAPAAAGLGAAADGRAPCTPCSSRPCGFQAVRAHAAAACAAGGAAALMALSGGRCWRIILDGRCRSGLMLPTWPAWQCDSCGHESARRASATATVADKDMSTARSSAAATTSSAAAATATNASATTATATTAASAALVARC